MAKISVAFTYYTGVRGGLFPSVKAVLTGSWDATGRHSTIWSSADMRRVDIGEDGCLCFTGTAKLDDSQLNQAFQWGVTFIDANGSQTWAIPTEVNDRASEQCHREFILRRSGQTENYYLTHCRRLGANKIMSNGRTGIRFAVWAPNARSVEVVMGTIWDAQDTARTPVDGSLPVERIAGGYVADNGSGSHPDRGPFAMAQNGDGVWETSITDSALREFEPFDHKPYMFRIVKDDGTVAYRSDLYSRCQIGFGSIDPGGSPYYGLTADLDGKAGCSVVVDPERVTAEFEENPCIWPEKKFIPDSDFWSDEFTGRQPPAKVEDLVIYELFLGSLDFGSAKPGTIKDAMGMLDYLVDLGVNAVELLPLAEFGGGGRNWGYATSHYFAIEYEGGGRDKYKIFIKECHRRGLAVIMDVVYNHYAHSAERAEYHYDSNQPDKDIYYWYEGSPSQYARADGGYLDNQSTAFAPRYHEEMVRKMFVSSAAALVQEFHVDGFRVDQTTSIHSYNVLHANGNAVPDANIYGTKFLRELTRSLRLIKPGIMLMAEDHSGWDRVTAPLASGGLGFDARWYSDFYHHLAGDTDKGIDYAKLLYTAAAKPGIPLAMDFFAGALGATGLKQVVYNESHDEAGNSKGPFFDPDATDPEKKSTSHRSIVTASNAAPLIGDTRRYAEARCRFSFGMTILSAGTPMFLFGEEVGAEKRFKYDNVLSYKEDIKGMRTGTGASLFRFYTAIIRFRLANPALRSRNIEILYVHNQNRVLAFRRWDDRQQFLVVASMNDQPFDRGYAFSSTFLPNAAWKEFFNSDAAEYGGSNVGNWGGTLGSHNGTFDCIIPSNGFVVFLQA
jgi:1,4-alpha-glucan branching enzyme